MTIYNHLSCLPTLQESKTSQIFSLGFYLAYTCTNICSMGESGSSIGPHSSQPLRTALLEMEEQVRGMLKFMEQENDSLGDGAETCYRGRPELTLLFEELRMSYHSLSNHFKSDSTYTPSSSTSSSKEIEHHKSYVQRFDESKLKVCNYHSQPVPGDENNTDSLKCLNELAEDFMSNELENTSFLANDYSSKKMNDSKSRRKVGDPSSGNFHWENAWRVQGFQFKKLMEENLQKQEELIRRNNYKREIIKELRFQLRRLIDENRDLQRRIIGSEVDGNHRQSQISRLKGIILGKLWCKSSMS